MPTAGLEVHPQLRPSASSTRPRRVARPSDDLSEVSDESGRRWWNSCVMCTQQGVARMSHQPSFDCAQPSSELPADAQGPYAKLASEAPLPARPNLQVNGPQLIPWGPFSFFWHGMTALRKSCRLNDFA
jgi:hypothetical protein